MIELFFLMLPMMYSGDQCELAAKDFQKEFGGSLVLIIGNEEIGNQDGGHWINRLDIHRHTYYFDWPGQRIFNSKERALNWYQQLLYFRAGKFEEMKMYDLSEGHPPFSIYWNS